MEAAAKPCPSCGHCPTCGRPGGAVAIPVMPYVGPHGVPYWVVPTPYFPNYPMLPFYGTFTLNDNVMTGRCETVTTIQVSS